MASNSLLNRELKKSIHFNLMKDTHAKLRIACFKNNISMQEFFEEVSQRVALGESDILDLINDISLKKRNKVLEKFSDSDSSSIFDAIENSNPLNEKSND